MLIRIGVRTDTDTISMDNDRSTIGNSKLTSFGHGIHRVEHIFPIAMDDTEILKTGEIIGHFTVGCLILFGNRNAVTVVLKHKDHRKTFVTGTVDGFIDKAFGSGGLSV